MTPFNAGRNGGKFTTGSSRSSTSKQARSGTSIPTQYLPLWRLSYRGALNSYKSARDSSSSHSKAGTRPFPSLEALRLPR